MAPASGSRATTVMAHVVVAYGVMAGYDGRMSAVDVVMAHLVMADVVVAYGVMAGYDGRMSAVIDSLTTLNSTVVPRKYLP